MKKALAPIMLLWFCLWSGGTLSAQLPDCQLRFSRLELSLEACFEEIQTQCQLSFAYSPDHVPLGEKIRLPARSLGLPPLLDHILPPLGLNWKQVGQRLILFPDERGPAFLLSGYVRDAESGEALIGARVYEQNSRQLIFTNDYGYFSLRVRADSARLWTTYATYRARKLSFPLDRDRRLTIDLEPDFSLAEVEINAREAGLQEGALDPALLSLSMEEVRSMPALMGEADLLKAVQLLPGVQAGQEGSSGLYVRGGGPDQNLVLLDGVPLYYVNHVGGFFSIFNADALKDVKLIKGGFPARYGGRLSSVLDVHMREGNLRETHGAGSLGLITGKFSIEGPIVKEKSSFIVSGRRSYLDLLVAPLLNRLTDDNSQLGYAFYDLNAKVNLIAGENDRFYLSMYSGHDRSHTRFERGGGFNTPGSRIESRNTLKWGNQLMAFRWNHLWSEKLFSNLTATYGYYNYEQEIDHNFRDFSTRSENQYRWQHRSGIQDWGLKIDFDAYPSPRHQLKFGLGTLFHNFTPGLQVYQLLTDSLLFQTERRELRDTNRIQSLETHLYLEDQWRLASRLKLNLGIHGVWYQVGEAHYGSLQPRMSLQWRPLDVLSLKAAYAQTAQFVHLLANPGADLPSDRWVPATEDIPPQLAEQVSLGGWYQHPRFPLRFGIEGYYKRMRQLIDYRDGFDFYTESVRWENQVETGGVGESYGVEFLIRKDRGKTRGWLGYTLSWNHRQFENINGGNPFPYRYDRRHDLKLMVSHPLSERVKISANWLLGSGNAITLATGRYALLNQVQSRRGPFDLYNFAALYDQGRNGHRMRTFHRLDVSLEFMKKTRWGERSWILGFYNLYNRRNPFFYYYNSQRAPAGLLAGSGVELYQFSFFTLLPIISYNFSF
jgi:hypothetical protein